MKNTANLFILAIIVIGSVIGVQLLWHVMSMMAMLAYALGSLVLIGGIGYAGFLLYRSGVVGAPLAVMRKPEPMHYKVSSTSSGRVYLFREEPTLKDIAMLSDELHVAKLELAGDIFPVENNSPVIVVKDDGEDAIKVKLKHASKKDPDALGWVGRSSLIQVEKRISQASS